jgi:hypothetical protein
MPDKETRSGTSALAQAYHRGCAAGIVSSTPPIAPHVRKEDRSCLGFARPSVSRRQQLNVSYPSNYLLGTFRQTALSQVLPS